MCSQKKQTDGKRWKKEGKKKKEGGAGTQGMCLYLYVHTCTQLWAQALAHTNNIHLSCTVSWKARQFDRCSIFYASSSM